MGELGAPSCARAVGMALPCQRAALLAAALSSCVLLLLLLPSAAAHANAVASRPPALCPGVAHGRWHLVNLQEPAQEHTQYAATCAAAGSEPCGI